MQVREWTRAMESSTNLSHMWRLEGGEGGRGFKLNVALTLFSKNYNYFGEAHLVKYIEQCSYKHAYIARIDKFH